MRLIAIGLGALALALSPAIASAADAKADKAAAAAAAKSHEQGMKEAPPLAQQAGVPCTITDANYVGSSEAKDPQGKSVSTKYYELVCQEGLGFVIAAPAGVAPVGYNCLALVENAPKPGEKDNGKLYCRLAANADPAKGLQPIVAKAGLPCTVSQARWMGLAASEKYDQYEVACTEGKAYVIQSPEPGSTHPLQAVDCLNAPTGACQYFPKEKVVSTLAAIAAPAGRTSCTPSDARYVGTLTNKDSYYELACTDGKSGFMFEVTPAGKYVSAIDCARASSIAGGCTLTTGQGQTTESATYTRLAKEIGYPCTVSSYRSLGQDTKSGRELVELACSDHPDGAFALLPVDKGQKGEYFNCARAEIRQLSCTLTPKEATYAKLTTEIAAAGKTCQVTNTRAVGVTPTGDEYIEAACSGGPGQLVQYAPGSEAVKGVVLCTSPAAKGIGGGCQLK